MKADNLLQVFEIFDIKPLVCEEIEQYYAERPSPVKELATVLHATKTPSKFLFSGHRGSGKSTELNILSDKVKDKYFVVKFSVSDTLSIHDITHIDLLLILGSEIYKQAFASGIKLSEELCKDLSEWMSKRTKIESTEEKSIVGLGTGLNFLFVKLGTKMLAEATTREEIRKELKPRLEELIEKINTMVYDVEGNSKLKDSGKKILVIIDDLDKLDLKEAEELFFQNSNSLTLPKCSIVYTIPISLVYSNKYPQTKLNFTDAYILPNIRISKSNGEKDEVERNILKTILEKRMNINLISDDALNNAIENSGGSLYQFIYLIRSASIKASMRDGKKIEIEDINGVINNVRNDFDRILRREHYLLLDEIHRTKVAVGGELIMELFHNLSILEYLNAKRWCDVHPLIVPLLKEKLEKLKNSKDTT